ncbi:MAG: glycosyltransferase [bacterium]|nr:glycosyltransferase [bacterium]
MPQELELFAQFVPTFAQTVLHVGCQTGELARAIKALRPAKVFGIALNPSDAANAEPSLDGMALATARDELPIDHVDVVILDRALDDPRHFHALLALSLPLMDDNGRYLFLTRHPRSWRVRAGLQRALAASDADLDDLLSAHDLAPYERFPLVDPVAEACAPDESGNIQIEGHTFAAASDEEVRALATMGTAVAAVRNTYQPMHHARLVTDAGRYDDAYDLLESLPGAYVNGSEAAVDAACECQRAMVLLSDTPPGDAGHRLRAFFKAQTAFFTAVAVAPGDVRAYQHQATLWRGLGNENMAARLLRTFAAYAPDEACRSGIDATAPAPPPPERVMEAPAWDPPSPHPRILFLTHPRPHFGLDIVYGGLCAVLGTENVVEFPWKGSLHGETPDTLAHYPCTYDLPGEPLTEDDVVAQVRAGQFDVLLFGDIEFHTDRDVVRRMVQASGDVPWFILDGQDDCENHTREALDHLGMTSVAGYFKREMLAGVEYGPNTWPLPFAYSDERVPDAVESDRTDGLFWAGNRRFGVRRPYLEHIESDFELSLNVTYAQDEYARALRTHRIGLNIFGMGFDTVRYWEIPAHGCMLLSERLPIHIPHDFEDGVSAVFFDDLPELMDKLHRYLDRPDECAAIARAGREHLMRYHTGSMRARQMLGWIQRRLAENAEA